MKLAYSFTSRYLKWLTGGIVCCLIVSIAWAAYRHQTWFRAKRASETKKIHYRVRPSLAIKGFAFDEHHEGRRTLSIKADSFIVDKKKIGFLRFGLLSTAKLKNAVIDIYGSEQTESHAPSHNNSNQTITDTPQLIAKKLQFSNTFSSDSLRSITKKRITGIEMEPVTIRVHSKGGVVSTICSKYAKISFKDRAIKFHNNVRVTAGPNTLTTDQLSLDPTRSIFRANRSFMLKTPREKLQGDYLETDLYLDKVLALRTSGAKYVEHVKDKWRKN